MSRFIKQTTCALLLLMAVTTIAPAILACIPSAGNEPMEMGTVVTDVTAELPAGG